MKKLLTNRFLAIYMCISEEFVCLIVYYDSFNHINDFNVYKPFFIKYTCIEHLLCSTIFKWRNCFTLLNPANEGTIFRGTSLYIGTSIIYSINAEDSSICISYIWAVFTFYSWKENKKYISLILAPRSQAGITQRVKFQWKTDFRLINAVINSMPYQGITETAQALFKYSPLECFSIEFLLLVWPCRVCRKILSIN